MTYPYYGVGWLWSDLPIGSELIYNDYFKSKVIKVSEVYYITDSEPHVRRLNRELGEFLAVRVNIEDLVVLIKELKERTNGKEEKV